MIKEKSIPKSRLFCVCPDCFLESEIDAQFEGDNYFITSLGADFYYSDEFVDTVKLMILKQHVQEVIFVWVQSCRFNQGDTREFPYKISKFNRSLIDLLDSNGIVIAHHPNDVSKNYELKLLHEISPRLETNLIKSPELDHDISIKVVQYDRNKSSFIKTSN